MFQIFVIFFMIWHFFVVNVLYASVGIVSSVSRAFSSKLRGSGFKSWPGTVSGLVTIMCGV